MLRPKSFRIPRACVLRLLLAFHAPYSKPAWNMRMPASCSRSRCAPRCTALRCHVVLRGNVGLSNVTNQCPLAAAHYAPPCAQNLRVCSSAAPHGACRPQHSFRSIYIMAPHQALFRWWVFAQGAHAIGHHGTPGGASWRTCPMRHGGGCKRYRQCSHRRQRPQRSQTPPEPHRDDGRDTRETLRRE